MYSVLFFDAFMHSFFLVNFAFGLFLVYRKGIDFRILCPGNFAQLIDL